jgi:uncharacterized protein (TIGR00730 family)
MFSISKGVWQMSESDELKVTLEQRLEPLPGDQPKPAKDEPQALKRIEKIKASPTYRLAYEDGEFLASDETLGPRILLEYTKPELELNRKGIEHTIVVFGSTRIPEPAEAQRRLRSVEKELHRDPDNQQLIRKVEVTLRILEKSHYYEVAREFANKVAQSGRGPEDNRVTLMTGGGPGIMEAANRGAYDANANTIGLNIKLPHEQFPNPYITPELCFQFHYFAIRKMHFLTRASALVAFPGGYGTMDELYETLTLIQTRKITPLPVVLVGEKYWRKAVDVDFLADEGVIDEEDRELFAYAETADEIWDYIMNWHRASGRPLLNNHEEAEV